MSARADSPTATAPRTDFVILCLGRTGSTHLASLLDSHPDITCLGELFSGASNRDPDRRAGPRSRLYVDHPQRTPTEHHRQVTAGVSTPVVGFKLAWNNLRAHPEALDVLGDSNLRVIRLVRENRLAKHVSVELSKATERSREPYGRTRVRLSPQVCMRRLEDFELQDRLLDELARDRPSIRVTYEALMADPSLDDVQRFLGVALAPLASTSVKRRVGHLRDHVSNWGQLERALTGTRYEHYLFEPAP